SQLVRLEHDGTTTWTNTTTTVYNAANSTTIADFDQDGVPEVYVANRIYDAISGVIEANGTDGSGTGNKGGYASAEAFPVAIDVFSATDIVPQTGLVCGGDCDGLELVAGNIVYAVNLGAAAIADRMIAVSTVTGTGIGDGVTSVADMDNDGDLDGVIMDNGSIYMWDLSTGTQLYDVFPVSTATTGGGRINLADFDNDGLLEAGVAGSNIYVLVDTNATSNLEAKWSIASDDGSQRTGSTVFDFEGDGINEVIYSDEEYLYVLNGVDGSDLSRVVSQSGTRFDYPLVADGNGDGVAEIIITSQDGNGPGFSGNNYIRMYRSRSRPWVSARQVWNQHTFLGTNINDDLSVPTYQQNHHIVPELNGFLVQSTYRLSDGSPSFAAPNVNPSIEGIDNTACGSNQITFEVKVGNTGDWKFPFGAPVAFYKGNPRVAGSTFIDTTFLPVTVDSRTSQTVNLVMAFSPGDLPADIYIVLNDTGFTNASLPFDISNDFPVTGVGECTYFNNYTHAFINASCAIAPDWDGDGESDITDLDSDNDGIPDANEDGGSGFIAVADADGDGILNYLDESDVTPGFPAFVDNNGDGVNDVFDRDDDSIPDVFDLDSDNDGIPDLIEAGGIDSDGNGLVDCYTDLADLASLTDVDGDGWCDTYDTQGGAVTSGTNLLEPDYDGDGVPDFHDLDSDNDGIPDIIEAGGEDMDGDGRADSLLDTDADGIPDLYDPDDDAVFGTDSGEGSQPLLVTSGDNGDGTPTGYVGADKDLDGALNHLELDADNDGIADITEVGGTDTDADGILDTFIDTDQDGLADAFDPDNGGTPLISTGADTNADGRPDSYSEDTDADVVPNFLDQDADNDGLPDNIEAQPTTTYTAAGAIDTDADGILDEYESAFLSPINTDTDGIDDYLDTDSDDDSYPDEDEAWDSYDDGDGINDGSCNLDADGDGILNCYDADDADPTITTISRIPPDDNGFNGTDYSGSGSSTGTDLFTIYPNNGGTVGEPDWRDGSGCALAPVLVYPITGTNNLYNESLDKHEINAATFGTIRATRICEDLITPGWTYYYSPLNPDQVVFAVFHGANTTPIDYVELRRAQEAERKSTSGSQGYFILGRDWFVKMRNDEALTAPVNIRFFFDPADSTTTQTAATDFSTDQGGISENVVWFKVDDPWTGLDIDPENGLTGLAGYTPLTPAAFGEESGLHYVQFDNLTSFSGGGASMEVSGTLPVELLSFQAAQVNNQVILNWVTATEVNSASFELERLAEGAFKTIGEVAAKGLSSEPVTYEFIDSAPPLDQEFITYRLRNIDLDGSFTYSNSIEVAVESLSSSQGMTVFPNPAQDQLTLVAELAQRGQVTISIMDINGRQILLENRTASLGTNTFELDVSQGKPGMYIISLQQEGEVYRQIVSIAP
ncbi:MAG: T9SS type A sorting domain-containing protein, partial [Bacteroidota bacterium]